MTKFVTTVADWLWVIVASLLVVTALALTVIRLLLPELNSQRENLADLIGQTVGRPAIVGEIDASWSGWVPRIQVHELALLTPSRSAELVRFESATINIAPLRSLLAGALTPRNLVLSGVSLTLQRDKQGRFSVAGMPPPKSPVVQWLIEQDNFAVTQADLTVIDEISEQSFALSDLSLTIRNRGDARILTAVVDLPPALGRRAVIELDATGDPTTSNWAGRINFQLDQLAASYITSQLNWQGQALSGSVDVVGWSEWQQGRLGKLDFSLASHDQDGQTSLTARGRMQRRETGWLLQLADLELPQRASTGSSAKLTAAWSKTRTKPAALALKGQALPIELVATLASASALEEQHRAALIQTAPSGVVTALEAAWRRPADTPQEFFADAELSALSLHQGDDTPGIVGLETTLAVRTNGTELRFDDASFKLNQDRLLVQTLNAAQISGSLQWRSDRAGHRISARALSGEINGSRFVIDGSYTRNQAASAEIDLRVDLPAIDAPRLHQLIPRGALPPRGEQWTRSILQAGKIDSGIMVLRGPLAKFPFRESEGVFAAQFDLHDGTLRYSNHWPVAEAVNGRVTLSGPSVSMTIDDAVITNADIQRATIAIDDLYVRERVVQISGLVEGPASSATAIVLNSPLRNGRAARLAELTISGDISAKLDMRIALFKGGSRDVLGQVTLAGNQIQAPKQNIVLDDFAGTISFTKSDWYGEGISASYKGEAVGLVINGGLSDPNYDSEFRMTGNSPASALIAEIKHHVPSLYDALAKRQQLEAISGELPWKLVLTIPVEQDNGAAATLPRRLVAESSLQGLALDFPPPLGKAAAEIKPLRAEFEIFPGTAVHSRIDFGDILDAEFEANKDASGGNVLTRAELLVGKIEPEFSQRQGINLDGYIAEFDLGPWLNILKTPQAASARAAELPLRFDLQIGQLGLFGNQFEDLRLTGTRNVEHWDVSLAGEQALGEAMISRGSVSPQIRLEFEHLRLTPADKPGQHSASAPMDPRAIPDLDFTAQHFAYGEIELGQAEIATRRTDEGLTLERLNFSDDDFDLTANGQWLLKEATQHSHFDISLSSSTLADVLQRFGYKVANIKDGETQMRINASWPGTPVDFSLARMTGNFELHVSDGRILDIEPGGGRLFGLLSIQTLPRRLMLDFNDIFRKGFVFDSIDGVFVLENGNAYTNSLLMSGPSARVNISGRTGLAAKDYDQSVVVTPALSSSIPVAGALFGPIGVGAGAVYYLGQKMFKSIPEQIDKFLSRKYSVTGPWEDPAIDRL